MSKHSLSEEIRAAVEWWAKSLHNTNQDAGAGGETATALKLFALRNSAPPSPEQDVIFIRSFTAALTLLAASHGFGSFNVSIDYEATGALAESAEVAGIDVARFPVKTIMRIEPGFVEVKNGYGARFVTIWGSSPPFGRCVSCQRPLMSFQEPCPRCAAGHDPSTSPFGRDAR